MCVVHEHNDEMKYPLNLINMAPVHSKKPSLGASHGEEAGVKAGLLLSAAKNKELCISAEVFKQIRYIPKNES